MLQVPAISIHSSFVTRIFKVLEVSLPQCTVAKEISIDLSWEDLRKLQYTSRWCCRLLLIGTQPLP